MIDNKQHKQKYSRITPALSSVILYVSERVRIFYCVAQSVTVFYVASEVANARVEDIAQRILPEEQIAEYSRTLRVFVSNPKFPKVSYCVDCLFEL